MNEYTYVNTGRGAQPFSVYNPSGIVIAIFASESRAEFCVQTMNKMKDQYFTDI
jgi:hypothetical protein